uniref:DNA damage-binding protein 1 n=1 Tax=Talaromyces marneffei PM1 TaxID=1077442 RepID=A0A093UZ16_TALMA
MIPARALPLGKSFQTASRAQRLFSTSLRRNTTWGFIGLGRMGYPMAKTLRARIPPSDTLIVHDVNEQAMRQFVAEAKTASTGPVEFTDSARTLAEKSTNVITSLPQPVHVRQVFHSILKPGPLPQLEQERLFIDCSTIDPVTSKEIAYAVQAPNQGRFVDAPMSGGVVAAEAGTLSFMFGASSKTGALVDRVKSVLSLMGKNAWHLGEQGTGVSGKLANNYILAINNIAVAEAMNLGIRWGLDPKVLADMINSSTGRCWPSEVNNPVPGVVEKSPASRDYEGGFSIGLMRKDLKLAIDAAQESGAPLELADKARRLYEAVEDIHPGKDFSVVYKSTSYWFEACSLFRAVVDMAYVVPIHRASSVRHALKLNFLEPEEDCLVVAKGARLEFYSITPDGLALTTSRALYAKVSMLARLPAPANSTTDHLFVGTDQNTYLTLKWDSEKRRVRTERSYVDLADKASRACQNGDRCLIDPSGKYMTLEIFEGIITVLPIIQLHKKRGKPPVLKTSHYSNPDEPTPQIGELGEPMMTRIDELMVRSSAFLHVESKAHPRLALLHEDNQRKVKLKIRELSFEASAEPVFQETEDFTEELDLGASHLIPVPAPLGGLLVLGETCIKYIDDAKNETISNPLDEATIFVAWVQVDGQRWLLADDYGRLFFLMLVLDSQNEVEGWKLDYLGEASRASVLIYLGAGMTFIGSHQGDSQVIRISEGSFEIIQTISNIAPILDFTIMDLGAREGENYTHEFSSGQARIVTGSGAFNDGTLRSVRSGVGMDELGVLGEMEHITDMWALQISSPGDFSDTLVVTFVNETRVFRFSSDGEVEELDEFLGLNLAENTLLSSNLPGGRIIHVTESGVSIADTDSGMVTSKWSPDGHTITSVACNDERLVVVTGGQIIATLDITGDLKVLSQKDFGKDNQVSGVTIPPAPSQVCIAAFPQNALVAVLDLHRFEELHSQSLGVASEAFPRTVLLAEILADSSSTLFVSMADGSVVTFSYDAESHSLTGTNKLILGSEQPTFKKLPRGDGLYNVFTTCEHPSLIYASEGRIIYSAVNSEGASRVCHFNTEAYPDAIAVATSRDLKIALVDKERTTQIQTLPIGATVRRVAYSPTEKAFGIGTIKRRLEDGAEIVESQFVLADEIMFRKLDSFDLKPDELVESVIRAQMKIVIVPGASGEGGLSSVGYDGRLYRGSSCQNCGHLRGDRAAANRKIFAPKSRRYRTSTAPVDIAVTDKTIVVADLMKSISIVESNKTDALTMEAKEVARHFATVWTTAVADIGSNQWLVSDAEGNLIVLRRNVDGMTEEDRRRLEVTSRRINLSLRTNQSGAPGLPYATPDSHLGLR